MAQSLVWSIDVCPGLGMSPLRTNIWLSFSQADLGPRSAQELFFSGFLKSLKLFCSKICAHSERYRNLLAGIFEIPTFYGNIAFPLSPVYAPAVYLRRKLTLESIFLVLLTDNFDAFFLSLIHISEPTRPERISYAVFCLKKKNKKQFLGRSWPRSA